jgi:ribonuclease P protein component
LGLSKAYRLKNWRDFRTVYQRGGRYSSPHLILRVLKQTSENQIKPSQPSRFGLSVSKKVSKKAVIRNQIKRQLRRAIQELLPIISNSWQVVIVVRSEAIECNYEHFLRELKQLLIKAEIIYGH